MKTILIFVLISLPFLIHSQTRITVIDKSSENSFLFDENNPQSLIYLLKTNYLPFSSMSLEQSGRLRSEGFLKDAPFEVKVYEDIALSNIEGEDSMAIVDSILQFIYPQPDTFYTDLKGISRFILYEHQIDSMGKSEYLIDSIAYAKKYKTEGKYEITGTLAMGAVEKEYELFYLEQLSDSSLHQFLNAGFWSTLKKNQLAENIKEVQPILKWNSVMSADFKTLMFEVVQPGKRRLNCWSARSINWPVQPSSQSRFDSYGWELFYGWNKVHGMDGTQLDVPLANVDGEDSMVVINGILNYVYPNPDFLVSWIDTLPTQAWLLYSVSSKSPTNTLKRIIFTQGETNTLLCDFNTTDPRIHWYTEYLLYAGIQCQNLLNETWKTALVQATKKAKKYSPDKKRDFEKLKKEFSTLTFR